jgi:hypothetical protein
MFECCGQSFGQFGEHLSSSILKSPLRPPLKRGERGDLLESGIRPASSPQL